MIVPRRALVIYCVNGAHSGLLILSRGHSQPSADLLHHHHPITNAVDHLEIEYANVQIALYFIVVYQILTIRETYLSYPSRSFSLLCQQDLVGICINTAG